MGTDAMPPLPPVNRTVSGVSDVSRSGKSKRQQLTLYDKVFGVTKRKKKKEAEEAKNLLNFYDNFERDLRKALKELLVDDVEQRSWLNLWLKIDPRRTNMMGFSSFCEIFCMNTKCIWSKRLLSRRSTHDSKTVLDMQDLRTFLKFKFKKTMKKANFDKLSLEVLQVVEQIPDHGIREEDIMVYSKDNPSIIAFANGFLTHLRMCIFGYFFWKERSQQLKKKASTGLSSIGFLKNANLESERLISSLHKIHGIRTRVPKRFQVKKKSSDDEATSQNFGSPVPLDIVISPSKSGDSKEKLSPEKKVNSPKKKHDKGTKKPKKKKSKPKEKSVIKAAKASIDPNLFLVDDEMINADLDDLSLSQMSGSFEVALPGNDHDSLVDNNSVDLEDKLPPSSSQDNVESLPDIHTIKDSEVAINEVTPPKPEICEKEEVKVKSPDDKKEADVARQESLLSRQLSRQFSRLISRQGSWLSRQDSTEEEEPDEETSEEKAARVASLRHYPIEFNVGQLLNTSFETDFPDIVIARSRKKNEKISKMREKLKIDLIAEQRTYNLMTQVLDDLVHQRRGKRIAFGRWLDITGMIHKSNNVANYRLQFKTEKGDAAHEEDIATKDKNEEAAPKKTFGFGFGRKKNKKNNKAQKEVEDDKKSSEKDCHAKEKKKPDDVVILPDTDDQAEVKEDIVDDDPQYALHKKIVQMTSNLQTQGASDTAYNDYMEDYRARCLQIHPDRSEVVMRESANFLVSLQPSKDGTSKDVVVYGSGVEYITRKFYLPENQIKE